MRLSCHCGGVSLWVRSKPETLTSCNCSLCHRYGALWGYYPPEEVTLELTDSELIGYQWGDQNIDLKHCAKCGAASHYQTTEKVTPPKLGVNFRMADRQEIEGIPIRHFDGADTWAFLD